VQARSKGTVLIVDDEVMVATALRSFLELETSHEVHAFTSPHEALACLEATPVDAVVADFMMPGMDGIGFLTEARRLRPEASRILLTGYADKENAIRAINDVGLYYYM
jgi:DNA-binding NtrC family response regulator